MTMMIQKSTDDVYFFKLKKLTMSALEENLLTFLKHHANITDKGRSLVKFFYESAKIKIRLNLNNTNLTGCFVP